MSGVGNGHGRVGDSKSGELLLRDIEAIGKALYLDKTPSRGLDEPAGRPHFRDVKSKSRVFKEGLLRKEKKSSIWNWKPLKALTHIGNRRFNCCFFLHVHSIRGLPQSFSSVKVCVHWKRKEELQTCPSSVYHGTAEFEETLMHRCAVYGSRNGPRQPAKYEAKRFLLYASAVEAPGLDLGRHWIDLTRFLPLTFEELEEDKTLGKWATSFKLSGKAEGAILHVSFGFLVMGDDSVHLTSNPSVPELLNSSQNRLSSVRSVDRLGPDDGRVTLRRIGSVSGVSNHRSRISPRPLFTPNSGLGLSKSISFLYERLDERQVNGATKFDFLCEDAKPLKAKPSPVPDSVEEFVENDCDDIEFVIIEQGIELPTNECLKPEEHAAQIFSFPVDHETEHSAEDTIDKNQSDNVVAADNDGSSAGELDPAIHDLDALPSTSEFLGQENPESEYKTTKIMRSFSLDDGDATESVANDFLKMLTVDHFEPESPRECLLRQYEDDIAAFGMSILHHDEERERSELSCGRSAGSGRKELSDDFDTSPVIEAAQANHGNKLMHPSLRSKRNVRALECLNTQLLTRDRSMRLGSLENSARFNPGGFGSPIYLPPEELDGFPP